VNKELDLLAKEYVKTKDKTILVKIFKLLKHILKSKADFVFYQKTFHEGKSKGYIESLDGKKTPVYEHNFKLVDTKQTELEDVEQELALEVIRILNKYNPKQPFENYLFAAIWNWTPKFARKNKFFNYLKFNSMNVVDEDGNEKSLIDNIPQEVNFGCGDLTEMFENLTENEKKIINLYQENNNISQSEIADSIGITQSGVSRLLAGLRKKYIY
jgi:RNA polymerase sigma factor (sigma-70 family)